MYFTSSTLLSATATLNYTSHIDDHYFQFIVGQAPFSGFHLHFSNCEFGIMVLVLFWRACDSNINCSPFIYLYQQLQDIYLFIPTVVMTFSWISFIASGRTFRFMLRNIIEIVICSFYRKYLKNLQSIQNSCPFDADSPKNVHHSKCVGFR